MLYFAPLVYSVGLFYGLGVDGGVVQFCAVGGSMFSALSGVGFVVVAMAVVVTMLVVVLRDVSPTRLSRRAQRRLRG